MSYCVPIYHEMEEDHSIPTPPGLSRLKKPASGEEDIVEILYENGEYQFVNQNQRPAKRSALGGSVQDSVQAEREIRSSIADEQQQHLFMHEEEMSSWLLYPLDDSSFDRDLCADLLYNAPPPPSPMVAISEVIPPSPPTPPTVTKPENSPRVQNFAHFSRLPIRQRTDSAPARDTTFIESNETPMVGPPSRVFHMVSTSMPPVNAQIGTATVGGTFPTAGDFPSGTCELQATSSPGGSRTSFSASEETHELPRKPPAAAEDRKRKAIELDDNEWQSEDTEFEATHEAKKHTRGSTASKRSRAAEVHNQSERRRRDRINEKMKALQELIPRCNKSDKASMLDEAIEYLKSLQLQVQMLSMGYGVVPVMYPGMQQFMPAMGIGMGMGMGMDMNRPMVPFASMMPGSGMPNPAAHMGGPRFPMTPPFQMPVHNPCRMQAPNQTDPAPNPAVTHIQNQPRMPMPMPNYVDPYQQYLALHHSQFTLPQNQGVGQAGCSKPITSKEMGNLDIKHQNG